MHLRMPQSCTCFFRLNLMDYTHTFFPDFINVDIKSAGWVRVFLRSICISLCIFSYLKTGISSVNKKTHLNRTWQKPAQDWSFGGLFWTSGLRKNHEFYWLTKAAPIPMAAWSEAWVCGRSLVGIVGSNPAGVMDICLLWLLYVVR